MWRPPEDNVVCATSVALVECSSVTNVNAEGHVHKLHGDVVGHPRSSLVVVHSAGEAAVGA